MSKQFKSFIQTIWSYYEQHAREFSWRESELTPYNIAVSEIMLQQTQADRVVAKYLEFIEKFPDWKTLAQASTRDVLMTWKGLGYNSRGIRLHNLARHIMKQDHKELPQTAEELMELPGIGPNTAGSILAFAFNIPHPFIETNIRTVYIHHFFRNSRGKISDTEILPLITQTLDHNNPREWYYALMDYGVFLKKTYKNPSRKSAHHTRQTKFKGSRRELASAILHYIAHHKKLSISNKEIHLLALSYPQYSKELVEEILNEYVEKRTLIRNKNMYSLPL